MFGDRMNFYLYIGIVLLIQSIISFNIMKRDAKPKSKILKSTKIHYLNLLYGKKAEFDKKYLPIIGCVVFIICFLLTLIGYHIFGDKFELSDFIGFIFIGLASIIMWKAFNKEILIYLCEDGIYYVNRFIGWDNIKEIKKENGFIKIIGKGKIFSQRIYLKYDEEIENIIKNQIEKFRDKV